MWVNFARSNKSLPTGLIPYQNTPTSLFLAWRWYFSSLPFKNNCAIGQALTTCL